MKILKLTLATVMAVLLFDSFANKVGAQTTQEQNQNQELKVHCETGAYGQNINCWAEGSQEQSQELTLEDGTIVIYRDGRVIPVHQVVDTAVDPKTLTVLAGSLISGATATIIKLKSKK